MLFVLAAVFLSQQATYFSGRHDLASPAGHVKIAAWLALSIVLLLMLATGGAWFPWDKTGLQFGTIQIIALSTS